ncbi:MAG: AMP-binding protein [Planctomycetia bacterium]|nr:AMP-binding protein [Planctomycetia bacterium]
MDKTVAIIRNSVGIRGAALFMLLLLAILLVGPARDAMGLPGWSNAQWWTLFALLTVSASAIIIRYYLVGFIAFWSGLFLSLVYRPRVVGLDNIPAKGGVLLVTNHVSCLDSLLIYTRCRRPVRFIAHADFVPDGFRDYISERAGAIRIKSGNRGSVLRMLKKARAALNNGEVVCVFAEGCVSRTGQIKSFGNGILTLLKGCGDIPVVPVYIGGFWGSMFSRQRWNESRFPWLPGRLERRVTLAFGEPMHYPRGGWQIHQRIQELGVDVMNPSRFPHDRHLMGLARQAIRNWRRFAGSMRVADSTGMRLTGRGLLLRTLIVRRLLKRTLAADEKFVGLLLPTAVGGVLGNVGAVFDRRVPVNLNYTFSNETNNYCLHKVGIKRVLTSRKLLQKLPNLKLDAELIILEDILKDITRTDKLVALFQSLLPTCVLERWLGLTKVKPEDINTIIFTSGSTGLPKGVVLTENNVATNIQIFMKLLNFTSRDRLLSVLPLFHSFGYVTGIWAIMTRGISCFYHYSPLDAKLIGEIAQKEKVSIMTSTPTFLRNYLRRCPQENFQNVDCVIPGAEKLPVDLAEAWKEKYGQTLCEGFGMTELSPVLAANIPVTRIPDNNAPYFRQGSIGRACAEFAVRIVHPDTGALLPPNSEGMLEVKGPCVMQGYYNEPEKTAASFRNGWFVTGDMARIDDDGFIFITGRRTRMSKIGGEMVPHVLIEEKIAEVVRDWERSHSTETAVESDDSQDSVQIAVTAVPDSIKGEKIVVLYTHLPLPASDLCKLLLAKGLPQIWVPAIPNFRQVPSIPLLKTGKLDLCAVKNTALALYKIDQPS